MEAPSVPPLRPCAAQDTKKIVKEKNCTSRPLSSTSSATTTGHDHAAAATHLIQALTLNGNNDGKADETRTHPGEVHRRNYESNHDDENFSPDDATNSPDLRPLNQQQQESDSSTSSSSGGGRLAEPPQLPPYPTLPFRVAGIEYIAYESELQMPAMMDLFQKDLSEPYSIYTYRYFIHNWPSLCFLAMAEDDDGLVAAEGDDKVDSKSGLASNQSTGDVPAAAVASTQAKQNKSSTTGAKVNQSRATEPEQLTNGFPDVQQTASVSSEKISTGSDVTNSAAAQRRLAVTGQNVQRLGETMSELSCSQQSVLGQNSEKFGGAGAKQCVGAIVCKLDAHKRRDPVDAGGVYGSVRSGGGGGGMHMRGYIAMLAVEASYRKRKIASQLVLTAIRAMVAQGADEVVLETEITNKPALRLYENLGFVRDKRLFRYYLNGVDAFRLKLWLR